MDIEQMKSKLSQIVDLARLRREWIERGEVHAPAVAESQQSEPQPQPAVESKPESPQPVVEIVPEPAPTPETHPHLFIAVHTPELVYLPGNDLSNDWGREVLSGKMIVTYRRRLPTDGDAEWILVPPKPRVPPAEEKIVWPGWGESGLVDPNFVAKYGRRERCWNSYSLGRNSGCLRWDDEIIP